MLWALLTTVAIWSTFLLQANAQASGIDRIQLAGLKVGAFIKFDYYGKKFGNVTFSINDDLGSGLLITLHHNKGCTGTEKPVISFNTITNGVAGESEDIEVDEIKTNTFDPSNPFVDGLYGWEVRAEQTGYSILQKNYFDEWDTPVSHFFKYRSPHDLSKVNEVKIEELEECESKGFDAYIFYEQAIIPNFAEITIEGKDKNNPQGRTSFVRMEFGKNEIVVNTFGSEINANVQTATYFRRICTLKKPVDRESLLGVSVKNYPVPDWYTITLSVDGVSKLCYFRHNLDGPGVLVPYLNVITKMVIN